MAIHGSMTISMKNKLNVINTVMFIILSYILTFGNVDIMALTNGIYVSESQLFVMIISDSTLTVESPYWAGVQPIPNKVYCKFKNIGCGFIQISSVNDYYSEAVCNMNISYNDSICREGNTLKFEFQNHRDEPLVVEVHYDGGNKQIVCKEGIGMLSLPSHISKFKFSVRPLIYNQYGYDYHYNGITGFNYMDTIEIHGSVVVSLPGIGYGYFDQWMILDEIVEIIDKDKIRWRDMILTKCKGIPLGNNNF